MSTTILRDVADTLSDMALHFEGPDGTTTDAELIRTLRSQRDELRKFADNLPSPAKDTRYNGWTNYETWNLALWIGNEQYSDLYWRERTVEAYKNAEASSTFTRLEQATLDLADMLKDETEENQPAGESGFYSDVMTAAIGEVNWYEIAEHWISDEIDESDYEQEAAA